MWKTSVVPVLAPALVIVYGLVRLLDGVDGQHGPGLLWTVGHAAFLVALFLFGSVLLTARRLAGGGVVATAAAVVGAAGLVCSIAQIGIDIVVGLVADDKAAMGRMFDAVQAVPGVEPAVYGVGPTLFYVALLALVVQLAVVRAVAVWAPVVLALGIGAVVVGLDLLPVAGLLILLALAPLARRGRAYA
ncbi:hypothetical protein [Nocardiopsis trehalosi]|uniref:hypothetical protein n=1 Tax=Nocardiopsis trehalosi TaxID=109329 RepID=UPI00082F02B6|nr:hypothetical protein [Nocardiopsis trehalosi]